jgi:hypothetical protein
MGRGDVLLFDDSYATACTCLHRSARWNSDPAKLHFYEGPAGCMHTKAVQVYAVNLDGAPPRELVVMTKETKRLKCTEPETLVKYQAYRLNAGAMRFDAFSAAPKVVKTAVEAAEPTWEGM